MDVTERGFRRWPLFLIAAPAAVAIWSGWVGLGGMAGFGLVHPLPGIVPGLQVNTAITLPVGVEAYGAYALGVWLSPGAGAARRFARWSAVGALLLGMSGQVAYHLLAAWHTARAPWPVVVAVSCMPVVTLGFGAALTHLLRHSGEAVPQRLPSRHEWRDLAAPVAAAFAARIAPSRAAAKDTPRAIQEPAAAAITAPASTPESTTEVRQTPRQDARQRDARANAIARAKAKRLLSATPSPTLAEVAAKTGLSERTVSRIKNERPALRVAGG